MRQQLLKYNNDLKQAQERQYQLEYQIEMLVLILATNLIFQDKLYKDCSKKEKIYISYSVPAFVL